MNTHTERSQGEKAPAPVYHAPRDGLGRFVKLVCVNATDRCAGSFPCPFCEPAISRATGKA